MAQYRLISFNHQHLPLEQVGWATLPVEERPERLRALKEKMGWDEVLYLATCNRVEILGITDEPFALKGFRKQVAADKGEAGQRAQDLALKTLAVLFPAMEAERLKALIGGAEVARDSAAWVHLFTVACSLKSLVVGEKEIFGQLRKAWQECKEWGLTGDHLRLLMKGITAASKEVFSKTRIAENPVSVVSLAYRELRSGLLPRNARLLFIGAGETNRLLARYLAKHGFRDIAVFNRSLARAHELAQTMGGVPYALEQLPQYQRGFDCLLICTGSTEPLLTPELYHNLLAGESTRKVIVDLGVPADTHPQVLSRFKPAYIGLEELKIRAEANKKAREQELSTAMDILNRHVQDFRHLLARRALERSLVPVQEQMERIRHRAVHEIFGSQMQEFSQEQRASLDKVLDYCQRKYQSIPMVLGRELLEQGLLNGTDKEGDFFPKAPKTRESGRETR